MEDEHTVEPDYLRGFNEGYTIAQHMPELAEQLAQVQADSTRMAGFKAGREQNIVERLKDRLPPWLIGDRSKAQDQDTKSKDRDIEPEK